MQQRKDSRRSVAEQMQQQKWSRGDAAEEVQKRKCKGDSRGSAIEKMQHVSIDHALAIIIYVYLAPNT